MKKRKLEDISGRELRGYLLKIYPTEVILKELSESFGEERIPKELIDELIEAKKGSMEC